MWSRYIVSELKSASCALELFYTYNIIPFLKPYRHLPTNKCLIGEKGTLSDCVYHIWTTDFPPTLSQTFSIISTLVQ